MKTMISVLMLLAAPAFAQTATPPTGDSLAQFYAWVQTQQANAGVSYDWHHTKYACTWWDLVSLGSSGLNVGVATSKDFVDFGPAMATTNAAPTRYGQGIATHVGNIWNAVATAIPGNVAKHVKITSLPDVTVGGLFLFPKSGALNKWNWRDDFQAAVAYRFGGATPAAN